MTIASLKIEAKGLGIKAYSKMRKDQLTTAVAYAKKTTIVRKGDLAITRKLGSAFLQKCKVAEWQGNDRYGYTPKAWHVPQSVLDQHGLTPLGSEAITAKRAASSTKAREAYDRRLESIANRIGATASGRLVKAIVSGKTNLDSDTAELIAYKASYRHEHTDYDRLLDAGHNRDDARDSKEEDAIPADWATYLMIYDFDSPEAGAMASVLKDPQMCHPCWFKEGEIAVRRAELDLSNLSYKMIRDAITEWRDSRNER